MQMEPKIDQQPDKSEKGGCFPTIFLFIGFGLLLMGVLSVLNTAFGWELVLEIYGSDLEVPKYWDATIALVVIGGIWTLIGYGINSAGFLRFYRKNKILTILGSIGILVGIFFALDAYDKKIKADNRASLLASDTIESEDEPEEEPKPAYNPYADREVKLIVSNPTLDTLEVFADGKSLMQVFPYAFDSEDLKPGTYQLASIAAGDTLDNRELVIEEGTVDDKDLMLILNIDSAFNFGILGFQDYYDPETHQKLKEAKSINYKMYKLHWHENLIRVNIEGGSMTLPRRASIDVSYGNALKLVMVPDELEGERSEDDRSKVFDFLIWKFIDEEKKGYMQDGFDFLMLSDKEKKKVILNRLNDDLKRFEESESES